MWEIFYVKIKGHIWLKLMLLVLLEKGKKIVIGLIKVLMVGLHFDIYLFLVPPPHPSPCLYLYIEKSGKTFPNKTSLYLKKFKYEIERLLFILLIF